MRVYNTLARTKQEFVPLHEGKVSFYLCGPTVYNHIHIGNARTFLSFDMIRRYLEYRGYDVTYVQNITDVDDKIINRAAEEGRTAAEVAAEYTQAFIDAMHALGVRDPTVRPRATQEIDAMTSLISCLVETGHAYEVEGDVYFSVRSFKPYGRLSGRDIEQMQSGARVEVDPRKRDPLDFALWKAAKPGEPSWPSPWSDGRPGWHIECSAMSARYLGNPFDIHAGGDDLVFPHHENEIAQSEACSGVTFANYWLHGGMLTIDREKMSKSEGNFLLLKDVLTHVRPQALRLLMLQTHYRSPFDYSAERLQEAAAALDRIESALRNIAWSVAQPAPATAKEHPADKPESSVASQLLTQTARTREQFAASMDDDFNTAGAVAALFDLVSAANVALANASVGSSGSGSAGGGASESASGSTSDQPAAVLAQAAATIVELLGVLGVDLAPTQGGDGSEVPAEAVELAARLAGYAGDNPAQAIDALLGIRNEARASKDWALADAVRDGLANVGYTIEDTAQGTRVVRK
ncbi:MAG: cysteine--tRNA ligase [Coriobacteriales bacterium]|jgi:cysteinyl-tRNA synthetase|nr:cysteine--tRNA ligase [Coriobacteriales bacterium]